MSNPKIIHFPKQNLSDGRQLVRPLLESRHDEYTGEPQP